MGHVHEHEANETQGVRLFATMLLNFTITAVEVVGGLFSGSLTLLSDALHNFSDGLSMVISYVAIRLRLRPKSKYHTFGMKRAEVFAAVINSVALLTITVFLFVEAAKRLVNPEPVAGLSVLVVASIGLVANVFGAVLLHRDAGQNTNLKSAFLHLFTDAISSVGVILGGVAIWLWKAYWVDPLLTFVIGLYICKEIFGILRETVHILMEGTPEDLSVSTLGAAIESIPGVRNVHHMHVWSVGDYDFHLEAHILADDQPLSNVDVIRTKTARMLKAKFDIGHATLQVETGCSENLSLILN